MVDESLSSVPGAVALYMIEVAIFLLTLPLNVLLIAMLTKMSTIRPDLKVLMLSFPCSFCMIIIARCVLIANRLIGQSSGIEFYIIHDSAVVYFSIGFIGVSIECLVATLSFRDLKIPFLLGLFIVSFQVVLSVAVDAWKSYFGLDYISFNIIVTTCNVLSLGAFPILWTVNKKCYLSSQRNRHLHTLADRYHIKENLHNIHSLIYLALTNAIVTFSTSALMFYLNFGLNAFNEDQRTLWSRYIIHAFHILIALYTLAFPLIAFYTNSNLYKKLPGWHSKSENRVGVLKSTHGNQMVMNAKLETDAYFNILQSSWALGLIKKKSTNS
ncbi:unnamed protein product [Toxocara canis]|uniref:Serpentine Receptor, class T n=1 Tax=Toxocara canis TaxID=6265 RepID=A0A183V5G4_TOXCA|nr:unnamed protein product [Toxocara canis]